MDKKRAIIISLLLMLGVGVVSGAKPRVVVLANSIDSELAPVFFGFLGNKGMEIVHTTASDFEQYKEEKFIVILGGPDANEGVGEIVQEVLSNAEQNDLRAVGASKKYTKINVFSQGQKVTVIAGSTRYDTKRSHQDNKENIASEAILNAYAPILYLNKDEKYFPLEIDSMRDNSVIEWSGAIDYYNLGNAKPGLSWGLPPRRQLPDESDFIGYSNGIYGRIAVNETTNQKFLQYWIFYPYNYGINNHEGDWEAIQINLDSNYQPISAIYFFHEWYFNVSWSELDRIGSIDNNHVKAYIGEGSHASYPTTTTQWKIPQTFFDFKRFDEEWEEFVPTTSYQIFQINDDDNFLKTPHNWGELTTFGGSLGLNGPTPPGLKEVYEHPETLPPEDERTIVVANSPVNLHIYDARGRHVGWNPTTEQIEIEIPNTLTYYKEENEIEIVDILTNEPLNIIIEGVNEGTFDLNIARFKMEDESLREYHIKYLDVPVIQGTVASVILEDMPSQNTKMNIDGIILEPDASIEIDLKDKTDPKIIDVFPQEYKNRALDDFYKDILYKKYEYAKYCNHKSLRASMLSEGEVPKAKIVYGTGTTESPATTISKAVNFEYENIDDNWRVTDSDDVALTNTDNSWDGKWLVRDLSSSVDLGEQIGGLSHSNYLQSTNASEKYGIRYDANGDGDVSDSDDFSVYNDFRIEDRTPTSLSITPVMRIGNASYLVNRVFKLKGQKYLMTDFDSKYDKVSLAPVSQKTVVNAPTAGLIIESAVTIPGTDIKIGLTNYYASTPTATFAIIEGGAIMEYKVRDSTTTPALSITEDQELIEGYLIYPTKLAENYIELTIAKMADISTITDGDTDVQGYAKAVVNDGDGWTGSGYQDNEFRLEDDVIQIGRGSNARIGNTNSYLKYNLNKKFDIVKIQKGELPIIKDTEVTKTDKTEYNLVLVGGPLENNLVAELVTGGKSTVDWSTSAGEIEVIPNAFNYCKYSIIVGGKDRVAIQTAASALAAAL